MRVVALLLCVALLSGCATQTFRINPNSQLDASRDRAQHFFIDGLGQSRFLNATKVCGTSANVAKVEVQQTFGDIIISGLTLGLYTPRHARVYCVRK